MTRRELLALPLLTPPLQKKELGGACALLIDKGAVNTRE